MKHKNPLSILFAGEKAPVDYIDPKAAAKLKLPREVFVRALPLEHLHYVLTTYEHKHLFVQLCTYTRGAGKAGHALYPEIPSPTGYCPVPAGWTLNLDDASIERLYELAERLNFQRAIAWAKGQIAAKKNIAPLIEMTTAQVMPLVTQVMQPVFEKLEQLSVSQPSAPSSSAAPANQS